MSNKTATTNNKKSLTPNKINNQQVELKEQLTQLLKQESIKEMLQNTMINTLTQIRRKNQKKKQARRSNKQQTSKILNITYSNVRCIKSKTKIIKETLFETQCNIFAITETNLKDK